MSTTYILSGTTFAIPGDYSPVNQQECIGGGGAGQTSGGTSNEGTGGGGGAYASSSNGTLGKGAGGTGAIVTVAIGLGGAAAGSSGSVSVWGGSTVANGTVGADFGVGGGAAAGTGGTIANSKGQTKNNGGPGSPFNKNASGTSGGDGGGGAGGPNGSGAAGGNFTGGGVNAGGGHGGGGNGGGTQGASFASTGGGAGGNNSTGTGGGIGGASTGGTGANGSVGGGGGGGGGSTGGSTNGFGGGDGGLGAEWDATHGSGGGGGGSACGGGGSSPTAHVGKGGFYGGGGAGSGGTGSSQFGVGGSGIIRVSWTSVLTYLQSIKKEEAINTPVQNWYRDAADQAGWQQTRLNMFTAGPQIYIPPKYFPKVETNNAWIPPDPAVISNDSVLFGPLQLTPPTGLVVTTPTFARVPTPETQDAWTPADPQPIVGPKRTPGFEVRVRPEVKLEALLDWLPPDPLPTLNVKKTPPAGWTSAPHYSAQVEIQTEWLPPDPLPTLNVKKTPPAGWTSAPHYSAQVEIQTAWIPIDQPIVVRNPVPSTPVVVTVVPKAYYPQVEVGFDWVIPDLPAIPLPKYTLGWNRISGVNNGASDGNAASPQSVTLPFPAPANSLIIVTCSGGDFWQNELPSSVTDDKGNSYSFIIGVDFADFTGGLLVYYCANINNGPSTITWTSGSQSFTQLQAEVFTPPPGTVFVTVDQSSGNDQINSGPITVQPPAVTTAYANELSWAIEQTTNNPTAPNPPYAFGTGDDASLFTSAFATVLQANTTIQPSFVRDGSSSEIITIQATFVAHQINLPSYFSRVPAPELVWNWIPPDPQPTLNAKLTPEFENRTPPKQNLEALIDWLPDPPTPQLNVKKSPPAGWTSAPHYTAQVEIQTEWLPADPQPITVHNLIPTTTTIVVVLPKYSAQVELAFNWTNPDPMPTLNKQLTPPTAVFVPYDQVIIY